MRNNNQNPCRCALKEYLKQQLYEARRSCCLTQAEFSEQLFIDLRSYARIEHGERMCCMMTFAAFLAFHCKDPEALAQEFRKIFESQSPETYLN